VNTLSPTFQKRDSERDLERDLSIEDAALSSLGGGLIRFAGHHTDSVEAVVYVIHGNNGNVHNLRHLGAAARRIELVGVSAVGCAHEDCIGGACEHGEQSISDMARRYGAWIEADVASRHRTAPPTSYFVGGYSGGGVIALEVADLLRVRNVVAVEREVILVDALPPHMVWPSAAAQYRQALAHLRHDPSAATLRQVWPWVKRSTANRTTRKVFREAEHRRTEQVASELGFAGFTEHGFVDLEPVTLRLLGEHPTRQYELGVLLIASASLWPMFPPAYGWHSYVDAVRTVVVPGDHHTMALLANAPSFMARFESAVLDGRTDFPIQRPATATHEVTPTVVATRLPLSSDLGPVDVSVVIATYNRRGSIGRLMQDLQHQLFAGGRERHLEIVIVNDGGTVSVEDELPDTTRFPITLLNRQNGGPAAARHSGIERTAADIVIILDDDMRVGPNFIDAHLRSHEAGAHVVYGLIEGEADSGPLFERFHQGHIDRWLEECRAGATPQGERLCTGNVSFRRNDYDEIGGFDRKLIRCEDRDLGIRLEQLGVAFAYSEEAKSSHHSGHTDVKAWRKRSAVYGESDVVISMKHPSISELSPWEFLNELPTAVSPLLVSVAALPVLGNVVGPAVYRVGQVLDRLGFGAGAVKLAGLTYGIDYYSGAGRRWGSASAAIGALRRWKSAGAGTGTSTGVSR
jgi:GT2 family glycosyltransferase/thioesterase domain-containing protein